MNETPTFLERVLRRLCSSVNSKSGKASYSQSGEDLIIDFVVSAMRESPITYLDLGAHHPFLFSNTYAFYIRGHRGMLVEADPTLCDAIRRERPGDVCLNIGVGTGPRRDSPFYVMSTRTLSTFSETEAQRYQEMGTHKIDRIINVPIVTLNDILEEHFPSKPPTFISVDIEGLDFEVVASMDYRRFRPPVICVETLAYREKGGESKDARICGFLSDLGYFVYADTYINTIFVDRDTWQRARRV